jgi:hypothetical protein
MGNLRNKLGSCIEIGYENIENLMGTWLEHIENIEIQKICSSS